MQGYASRDAVLNILMDHETTGAFLKQLFPRHTHALAAADKGLVRAICLGVIRNQTLLDFNIDKHALKKPSGVLRAILRLSAYQIFFLKVPDFAAVNIGAELAKQYEGVPQAGFVNVVLKKLISEGLQKESGDSISALAVNFSHPEWLVKRWFKRLGRKGLMQALERNNQEAPLWLRVNTAKARQVLKSDLSQGAASEAAVSEAAASEAAVEAVEAALLQLEVKTERDGFAPIFLKLTDDEDGSIRGGKVALHSEFFKNGVLAFQDPAAWMIAELANWSPKESLIDLCAAPGGKSACVMERAAYLGNAASASDNAAKDKRVKAKKLPALICNDISFRRLSLMNDVRERLGHRNLLPLVMDGAYSALRKTFDVVLVDAPCSNLGVLRRRPEARWTHDAKDLQRLAVEQRALLEQAMALCSEKGRIIYATCSPEEEETETVIAAFLKDHKNWCLVDAGEFLPPWTVKKKFLWLHPGESDYDGFFAARLERVKS